MLRRPPIATRTDTLFPYTTLFRSMGESLDADVIAVRLTGPFRFVVAAAPAYIARYGRPETPGDLREHRCVRLRLGTGAMMPWTFARGHPEFEVAVTGPVIGHDFHCMVVAVRPGVTMGITPGPTAKAPPEADATPTPTYHTRTDASEGEK